MHFHLIMCVVMAVCLCAVPVLAATSGTSGKSASRARYVEDVSQIAFKSVVSDTKSNFNVKIGKDFGATLKNGGAYQKQYKPKAGEESLSESSLIESNSINNPGASEKTALKL